MQQQNKVGRMEGGWRVDGGGGGMGGCSGRMSRWTDEWASDRGGVGGGDVPGEVCVCVGGETQHWRRSQPAGVEAMCAPLYTISAAPLILQITGYIDVIV